MKIEFVYRRALRFTHTCEDPVVLGGGKRSLSGTSGERVTLVTHTRDAPREPPRESAPPRKRATNRCVHVSGVCVYDVQRAFAGYTHARRSVAGVHKAVCVRTRVCVCMNVRASVCTVHRIVRTLEHAVTSAGYTTRSLRGYWVGAAGRPAGLPPIHRGLSPLSCGPLPESVHLREHGGPLYAYPARLLCLASLRGPLSFSPPAPRLYTRSPTLPPPLSPCYRKSTSYMRTCVCIGFAHARIDDCVRAAREHLEGSSLSLAFLWGITRRRTLVLPVPGCWVRLNTSERATVYKSYNRFHHERHRGVAGNAARNCVFSPLPSRSRRETRGLDALSHRCSWYEFREKRSGGVPSSHEWLLREAGIISSLAKT